MKPEDEIAALRLQLAQVQAGHLSLYYVVMGVLATLGNSQGGTEALAAIFETAISSAETNAIRFGDAIPAAVSLGAVERTEGMRDTFMGIAALRDMPPGQAN